MSESIKFSKDEVTKVNEVQEEYIKIQDELGRLSIARIRLQQESDAIGQAEIGLRERFTKNQEADRKTLDKITAKYGDGTLDSKTGVFTPNKSE